MSIYLNSPRHAQKNFGLENSVLYNNIPLHKFQYAVRININPGSGQSDRLASSLTVIAKTVQLPQVTFATETINEYNRSRTVYTKVNYGDCNITFHDVADGKTLNFWKKYFKYYFADVDGLGFGLDTAFIQNNDRRYMIDTVDIYQFQAGRANRTRLMYPKITSFTPDTLDYSEVGGISQIQMSFKPEYLKYNTASVSLPEEILDSLRQGAPLATLTSSIDTLITLAEEDELKEQIANEIAATQARATNDRQLEQRSDSFNQTTFQPVSQALTSSSSLSLLGLGNDLVRTIPTGFPPVSQVNSSSTQKRPSSIGNVNSDNQQGGR